MRTPGPLETLIADADQARDAGDRESALRLYADAYAWAPERLYALYWLATLMQEAGRLDEAWAFAQRALANAPDQIAALARAASIASDRLDHLASLELYERVRRLAPDFPNLDALTADQLCFLGRIEEGIAAFDRAIASSPDACVLEQSRLFCLNYSDRWSASAIAEEHRAWGRRHGHPRDPAPVSRGSRERLHIGYVSPDLRDHAVAHFVAPLLAHHDRTRFEISVFDLSTRREDATSARMRVNVDHWHRLAGLSDEAIAAAIRAQAVDVLFDLCGHTAGNRLLAFAYRPAPVQVSWLGYLATTGLPAMDYRMTDADMDPPGMTEPLHTEALIRLPVQACFSPSIDAPPVGRPPSQAGAPFTFGSVNQWSKVSPSARDVWGRILADCAEARLFVIARGGQNPALQRKIADDFERRGARAGQVSVFPFGSTSEFLRFLGRIDVALDPFPYGGGTTTMQCLWMGVPVVTLEGAAAMARNSVGPLRCVGLADLVADSPETYRCIARGLAADAARLRQIRCELRTTMAASLLTDASAFARSVEDACRAMWAGRAQTG